jgi:hypothetical protein
MVAAEKHKRDRTLSDEDIKSILDKIYDAESKNRKISFPRFVRVYLEEMGEAYLYELWSKYAEICEYEGIYEDGEVKPPYKPPKYSTTQRYIYQMLQHNLIVRTRQEEVQIDASSTHPGTANLRPSRKRQYYQLEKSNINSKVWDKFGIPNSEW